MHVLLKFCCVLKGYKITCTDMPFMTNGSIYVVMEVPTAKTFQSLEEKIPRNSVQMPNSSVTNMVVSVYVCQYPAIIANNVVR